MSFVTLREQIPGGVVVLGLDLKTWLGFAFVGALVSTIGSILGIVIKEYFFSRSFELWKQDRALEQIYQKYRDPLRLSARELGHRLVEICDTYPTVFLSQRVFDSRPLRQERNSDQDPYYQRYKFVSTLYRLCAFLGWLELYRQELTFYQASGNRHTAKVDESLSAIRSAFADGHINTASDWDSWRDTLVFREELRAIGESMIESRGSNRSVIGYGCFVDLINSDNLSSTKSWSLVVLNFLLNLEDGGKDFRKIRLQRILCHVVDFIGLIDKRGLDERLKGARKKWSAA
ncbi:hypothetical protein FJ414_22040 [Mesorhizobium sp. B3-1-6]|uniref:hypothetical protein n=1 Tax=Mesorhizobium sp. B3-1-6 TaxID=2589895 RepID=UPI00112A1D6A|nr:hypothetical protein [Mesorhizobium sp. B3-1-6]TPI32205.1 hypothetical protein FJ414_22040 [Mesorhizobium sp. B3-1-6]